MGIKCGSSRSEVLKQLGEDPVVKALRGNPRAITTFSEVLDGKKQFKDLIDVAREHGQQVGLVRGEATEGAAENEESWDVEEEGDTPKEFWNRVRLSK